MINSGCGQCLGFRPSLVARFQRWIVLIYFYFDMFGYFVVLGFQRFNQYQWGKIYGHPLRSFFLWWKTGPIPGVPGCALEPEECYWELAQNADGKSVLIHLQKTLGTASPWGRAPGIFSCTIWWRELVCQVLFILGSCSCHPLPLQLISTNVTSLLTKARTHVFFHMKVEKRWTEMNRDEQRWTEMKRAYTNLLKWLRTRNTSFQGTQDLLHMQFFLWPCWFDMVWY